MYTNQVFKILREHQERCNIRWRMPRIWKGRELIFIQQANRELQTAGNGTKGKIGRQTFVMVKLSIVSWLLVELVHRVLRSTCNCCEDIYYALIHEGKLWSHVCVEDSCQETGTAFRRRKSGLLSCCYRRSSLSLSRFSQMSARLPQNWRCLVSDTR